MTPRLSAIAVWSTLLTLVLIAALIIFCILSIYPLSTHPPVDETDVLMFSVVRNGTTLIVTNEGGMGTPDALLMRLEVFRDGIFQGTLGLERGSHLTVEAPGCPADLIVQAFFTNNCTQTVKFYHDESCDNGLLNLPLDRSPDFLRGKTPVDLRGSCISDPD